jgi:KaiC/GvpD/RAD55 family RecA-like ATPase
MSLGPVSAGFFVVADPHPRATVVVEGPEDALAIRFAMRENISAPDACVVAMMGQRWAAAAEAYPGAIFFPDADSVDRAREAAASCGGWIVDPRPAKDANEILTANGAHALWDRVTTPTKAEAAPETAAPCFVCIADLAGQPVSPREWHVADLVPARTVTTISGDGGVGKSLLALQLAISTALGIPWAGRSVDAAPVLFITAEDDLDEVRRRVVDICALIDRDPAELHRLEVLSLAGWDAICAAWDRRTNTMAATALYDEIDAKVRDTGAKLAIFDTLADLHSGQENDRAHARQVISQFRGLALRHDCAASIVTARSACSTVMRCSGAATRPDCVIRLTAHDIMPIGSLRPIGRSE